MFIASGFGMSLSLVTSNVWTTELAQLAAEDREWLQGNAILIQCSQPLYRQD